MQLEAYIKDLLYRYECVIIPGFGAFLTQQQPATVDLETHTFHPPCKSLSFNRQLQTNDGILANHLARATETSYETALGELRQRASLLKQKLVAGESVVFDGLGYLQQNPDGGFNFSPAINTNFLTSSFGLSSYSSPAVVRESEAVDETPVRSLPTPEHSKTAATPWLRYAAIGLTVIGLSAFSGLYFYADGVRQHNVAEKQKAEKLLENKIQQATFVVSNPLPQLKIAVEREYGNYHLVAGAFREVANAEKKVAQLRDQGYKARNLGANKYGLHQVVYGSYVHRAEALAQLRQLQKTENPHAWLLVE